MPVNPRYLQQNNDFSRKPPFLSILIVIAARQGLLEPPQGDTAPQEPSRLVVGRASYRGVYCGGGASFGHRIDLIMKLGTRVRQR